MQTASGKLAAKIQRQLAGMLQALQESQNKSSLKSGGEITFFDRLRYLVDVEMRNMNETELKTLLIFMRHASPEGVAYPGPALLAAKLGVKNPRHAKRYVSQLQRKGLLGIATAGGGRGKITKRIVLPYATKTVAQCATDSDSPSSNSGATAPETVAQPDPKQWRNGDQNSGAMRHPKRVLREQEKRTTTTECAAAEGSPFLDSKTECRKAMRLVGIGPPLLNSLPISETTYPIHVVQMFLEARDEAEADNPAGLVISKFREGNDGDLPDLLEPKEVCDLINQGWIKSVANHDVTGVTGAKWNSTGVTIAGMRIPDRELWASSIEVVEVAPSETQKKHNDGRAVA